MGQINFVFLCLHVQCQYHCANRSLVMIEEIIFEPRIFPKILSETGHGISITYGSAVLMLFIKHYLYIMYQTYNNRLVNEIRTYDLKE